MKNKKGNKKKRIKDVEIMVPLEKLRVGDIEIESVRYNAFELAKLIRAILEEQVVKEYLELYKKKRTINGSYIG